MKNTAAQALGALGGQARAKALSKKRLKEISKLGNDARWKKHRADQKKRKAVA